MDTDNVGGLRLEIKTLRARVDECEQTVMLMRDVMHRLYGSYCAQQKALEGVSALLGIPRQQAGAN